MASQQTHPPQTGAQVLRTEKVFLAERGVLTHAHTVGIQLRTWQNPHVETGDLHGPSECSFQVCYKVRMYAVGPRQKRHPGLQDDDENYDHQRRFPPLLRLAHLARKFRRLTRKKVGVCRCSD